MTDRTDSQRIVIGRVGAAQGIRGFNKVISFTKPAENILNYLPWQLCLDGNWQEIEITEAKQHGQHIIAQIAGCIDRDEAKRFTGADIAVHRGKLPELKEDEHYWLDLIGMTVVNQDEIELGKVDQIMETGANDVLIVQGDKQHAIPYILDKYILKIDTINKIITVNWDPGF